MTNVNKVMGQMQADFGNYLADRASKAANGNGIGPAQQKTATDALTNIAQALEDNKLDKGELDKLKSSYLSQVDGPDKAAFEKLFNDFIDNNLGELGKNLRTFSDASPVQIEFNKVRKDNGGTLIEARAKAAGSVTSNGTTAKAEGSVGTNGNAVASISVAKDDQLTATVRITNQGLAGNVNVQLNDNTNVSLHADTGGAVKARVVHQGVSDTIDLTVTDNEVSASAKAGPASLSATSRGQVGFKIETRNLTALFGASNITKSVDGAVIVNVKGLDQAKASVSLNADGKTYSVGFAKSGENFTISLDGKIIDSKINGTSFQVNGKLEYQVKIDKNNTAVFSAELNAASGGNESSNIPPALSGTVNAGIRSDFGAPDGKKKTEK
jgi:hypothetical protein